jgi:hypothetical protein
MDRRRRNVCSLRSRFFICTCPVFAISDLVLARRFFGLLFLHSPAYVLPGLIFWALLCVVLVHFFVPSLCLSFNDQAQMASPLSFLLVLSCPALSLFNIWSALCAQRLRPNP